MKPCGSCSWVSSIYEKIIVKNQYSNTFIYQNWSEAGVTRYPSNEFIKIFKNKIWRFLSWWRPNPLAYILCLESPSFLFKQNGTFIKIFKNKIWRFLSWWRPNPLAYILCLESPSFLFKQNGTFFSDALKISFYHGNWIFISHFLCPKSPFQYQNKSVLIYLPLCVPSGKLGAGSHKVCIQPIESVLFYFFEISEFRMFKQCIFLILLFNFRCPTWKTRRWSPPLNLPAHPINKSAL